MTDRSRPRILAHLVGRDLTDDECISVAGGAGTPPPYTILTEGQVKAPPSTVCDNGVTCRNDINDPKFTNPPPNPPTVPGPIDGPDEGPPEVRAPEPPEPQPVQTPGGSGEIGDPYSDYGDANEWSLDAA